MFAYLRYKISVFGQTLGFQQKVFFCGFDFYKTKHSEKRDGIDFYNTKYSKIWSFCGYGFYNTKHPKSPWCLNHPLYRNRQALGHLDALLNEKKTRFGVIPKLEQLFFPFPCPCFSRAYVWRLT